MSPRFKFKKSSWRHIPNDGDYIICPKGRIEVEPCHCDVFQWRTKKWTTESYNQFFALEKIKLWQAKLISFSVFFCFYFYLVLISLHRPRWSEGYHGKALLIYATLIKWSHIFEVLVDWNCQKSQKLLQGFYFLESLLSFARQSRSWQLFEATDLNGSSDRQCGLCSRNCERQRWVWRILLHIVIIYVYHGSFFKNLSLPVDWDSDWYE